MDRAAAVALDDADPLAGFVPRFHVADPDLVYCLGNSLGRLPLTTADRIRAVVEEEWGGDLVRGWDRWTDLPQRAGDAIGAAVLGAGAGQVVVADSTSVNLYRAAAAAVGARDGRSVIVTDRGNFPTDRYVLEELGDVRWVAHWRDLAAALDDDVALVSLSAVDYRTAEIADVAAVTAEAHAAGALVLWDVSHAAGVVELSLDRWSVDLAVGCSYKYLNGGPGAPAFLYAAAGIVGSLHPPVHGWFSHADPFTMGPEYEPAAGIQRFLAGTPNVIGINAVEAGAAIVAEAGMPAVRSKSLALTGLALDLFELWLRPLGFELASPREPDRRAGHISLRRADVVALRDVLAASGTLVDARPPDFMRLAFSPLPTRFVEVWDAMARLRDVAAG